MKEKVMHITAIIAAVIFSLILVASCVMVPLYYSVTVFTKPETVVKLVQGIDYKTVILKNEKLVETVEQVGLSAEQIDNAIKSEEATKILGVYADDALEILMSLPTEKEFDVAIIKGIIDDNIDEVLDVASQHIEKPINKESIKQQVNTIFETKTEVVETVIPVLEPIRVVIETVKESKIIMHTLTPAFVVVVIVVLCLMAILIALLRYRKLRGLIWLSVDFFVSAIAVLTLMIFSKNTIVLGIAERVANFDVEVLRDTFAISLNRLNMGFIILAVLCIACVASTVVYRVIKHVKGKKQDNFNDEANEVKSPQNNVEKLAQDNP